MNTKAVLALLALAVTPALAGAQTVTPAPVASPAAPAAPPAMPGMRGPGPAMVRHRPSPQMLAAMKKLRATQEATKAKIFASLSSAHRAYVANVIGTLAISIKPNFKAAAMQIDAKLTAAEKKAVLAAQAAGMAQTKALLTQLRGQMRAQWQASGASPLPMPSHRPMMRRAHKHRVPDAGAALLRAARIGEAGPGMMGPGMMLFVHRERRPM